MSGHLHIYGPHPAEFPSGGNRYNQQLRESLSRLEYSVSLGPAIPEKATGLLVDTLYSEQPRPDIPAWLLVHYLPGMEAGMVAKIPEPGQWQGAIVTGDVTRKIMRSGGWTSSRLLLLYPGRPAIQLPRGRNFPGIRIAWIGNLLPNKGILPMLHVLTNRQTDLRSAGVKICLAGSAAMDPDYAMACRAKLDHIGDLVDYRGALSSEQMRDLLSTSNWFLSTSEFETFGMALLEARAAGLPILAYTGGTGVHTAQTVLTTDGPEALLAVILRLAANPKERTYWQGRARADAEKLPEQFPDWPAQARRLADYITVW